MKQYYRIMLGRKSNLAEECYKGNYIGAGFYSVEEISSYLSEDWKDFNKILIPKYLSLNPEKTKMAAGSACGSLWTISKGIKIGDIVLCPKNSYSCYIGEVISEYYYEKDTILPHKRKVKWFEKLIEKSEMSESLSTQAWLIGTVHNITKLGNEIENFIENKGSPILKVTDPTIESPEYFAMEKHLEEFLIENWTQTEFGKNYTIWEEDGELVGQQYETDTGPIDILAISKDKKTILVIELKKGKASDAVVGQIQRYMGYVQEELSENNQEVKGAIVALNDDKKLQRALVVTKNIEFYKYKINFQLIKS
jgi:restriction system protein